MNGHFVRTSFDTLDVAILAAVATGLTNAEIGAQLAIAGDTVKKRLGIIGLNLGLGANDRAAIVATAIRRGVIA